MATRWRARSRSPLRSQSQPVALDAVVSWLVSALVAVVFLMSGAAKLASLEPMVEMFRIWGYPMWFMYVVGVIEVGNALLLVVPRTSFMAAGALALVMIGALVTHLVNGELEFAIAPIVMLALLSSVMYMRLPEGVERRSKSASDRPAEPPAHHGMQPFI